MAYKLVKARQRATEYYFKVLVNPEAPEEEQIFEEFHWGLDVPKARIKAETTALLDAQYGIPDEEIMPEEGQDL